MKNNTTEIKLTTVQSKIVKKYAPKKIYGSSEDSFHNCVRACAYAFCGGKDKYKGNEDLYLLGKKAWFKAYNTEEYRKTCEDYVEESKAEKPKAEKPTKTARGSSKKSTSKPSLEARVDNLEAKLDKILEMLSK